MLEIDGNSLTIENVERVANGELQVVLSSKIADKLDSSRKKLDNLIKDNRPYYGINTGFGALAETAISKSDLLQLQKNLIHSHAVGVGPALSFETARAMLLLRANTLAKGFSGCRSVVVKNMLALLNAGYAPYVPSRGSVGASGDLAPLAHLALLLLGEGKALMVDGEIPASDALRRTNIEPIILQAKEGLSIINGTQAMSAIGCVEVLRAHRLALYADIIGACSWSGLRGLAVAFDPRIHEARRHEGQVASAALIRKLVGESSSSLGLTQGSMRVQDPYSLRCMPQVHGATRDCIKHVRSILEIEINSATDNPLIFDSSENDLDIISGGNFHGQPIALALDYAAIAIAELANISERRMEQMLNPALSGLPAFLSPNPGINSGFMILQVTAASLVNENKILSHPASTDSIPTSANREDHVSMGMTSANKLKQIVDNVETVLSIELLLACQALDLRGSGYSSKIEQIHAAFRKKVEFAKEDRAFRADIELASNFLKSGALLELTNSL